MIPGSARSIGSSAQVWDQIPGVPEARNAAMPQNDPGISFRFRDKGHEAPSTHRDSGVLRVYGPPCSNEQPKTLPDSNGLKPEVLSQGPELPPRRCPTAISIQIAAAPPRFGARSGRSGGMAASKLECPMFPTGLRVRVMSRTRIPGARHLATAAVGLAGAAKLECHLLSAVWRARVRHAPEIELAGAPPNQRS